MKFEVNFYSIDSDWDKTVIVDVNKENFIKRLGLKEEDEKFLQTELEKIALQSAAKKLGFDGWYTDDDFGYGDLYYRNNGMSFHEGSRSKGYSIELINEKVFK